MGRSIGTCLAIGGAALLAGGCAPVFSDLQSARLVGPQRVEITPSISAVSQAENDEGPGGHVQDEYGIQLATGVHERVDLRARLVRVDAWGDGATVVGLGPKVGIVKDRLSIALPVGFGFGEDIDTSSTWEAHPTVLFTLPVSRRLELNAAAKSLIPLSSSGGDPMYALNFGGGIGRLDRWAIRPEVGFLWAPDRGESLTHVSLGFTYITGKR
jgi:hypothetical protein